MARFSRSIAATHDDTQHRHPASAATSAVACGLLPPICQPASAHKTAQQRLELELPRPYCELATFAYAPIGWYPRKNVRYRGFDC